MIKPEQDIQDLFDFIEESPCAFQAVASIQKRLEAAGFEELYEQCSWKLQRGGKYFVKRNDSSLISFVIPKKNILGFHMIASHTDSPSFKIKANPEIVSEDSYVKINTEKYGGMILSTWLDRPLSVAGRVYVEEADGSIVCHLVHIDQDLMIIPNLAIHMNGELNKGYHYNPQVDMLPILTADTKKKLLDVIAQKIGVAVKQILSDELFVYVRQKGCTIGANKEWIVSPRLDDLQCAYAALRGILLAKPEKNISLCAFFDNEEVGSGTKQGADSTFLSQTMWRIKDTLDFSSERYEKMLAQSFLLSADNAHALHPNHPEKADLTNRPKMNGGIVLKYHGGQKYTTDAYSAAVFIKLCKEADVPYQTYCNRSDIPGGSTLGNISTSHVSVPSVDIGFAQLAMHSAVETAGSEDIQFGVRLFSYYLSK